LIDALFERVAPMLEVEQERDDISGYSFGARFEDKRALGIALDMAEYFVVRLTLDLALGARQGEMSLLLPRAQPETESSEQEGQGPESNNAAAAQMNAIAMGLPAELTMVLCRLSLGLSELEKLTIGDVLKLPHNTFPETEITTGAGMTIGSGILGQVNGMRALRLKREPVHANHPRRRESDLLDLDLPEITALPSNETTKGRAAGENDDEPSVENSGAEIRALKTKSEQADDTIDKPPANMRNATQETGDDVLPELDDFPDLMDLQQEIQTG
jgi:flagellar motor switch protein FliM